MQTGNKTSWWMHLWRLAVLSLLTACAYSNSLQTPFVFDDEARIVNNEAIRTAWPLTVPMADTNRPFAFLTFAWNYALHGLEPFGFHLTNLLVHLCNAWLLYCLVYASLRWQWRSPSSTEASSSTLARSLTSNADLVAWATALLWALHPLATQAVTYTVQRLEALMTFGFLLALFGFLLAFRPDAARTSRWIGCALSWAACAFAMGCKEVAVTIPIAILWYDRSFIATSWREIIRSRKIYYLGLFSCWAVLAWAMLRFTGDYTGGALASVEGLTPLTYLLNQSAVLTHYLQLTLWPAGQCFFYNWPIESNLWSLVPYCLLIGTLFLATIGLAIWKPRLGFVCGMFFLVLSPTSSVVPIEDLAFEHRMYLPLASVVCLFCVVFAGVLHWGQAQLSVNSKAFPRGWWYGLTTLGAVLLACATFSRNSIYESHVRLWKDTVEKAPHNYEAWHNLAAAQQDAGDDAAALASFERAVQVMEADANLTEHEHADALASFGAALVEAGELSRAVVELERALEVEPTNYLAARNLGSAYLALGQMAEANRHLSVAFQANPSDVPLQIDLGAVAASTGNFYEAIRLSEQVLAAQPMNALAHVNLACGLGGLGRTDKAIEHCRLALQADPNLPNAHGTLALLLANSSPEKSLSHLQLAAELETQRGMYDAALGDHFLVRNDLPIAQLWYQKALSKEASLVGAHLGLFEVGRAEGQMDVALKHLRTAVQLRPEWGELKQQLQAFEQQVAQKPVFP